MEFLDSPGCRNLWLDYLFTCSYVLDPLTLPEFLLLSRPTDALHALLGALPDKAPGIEEIETTNSLGRVLSVDIHSPHPLPEFPRSTVDGYALKARDTFGASEAMPGYLTQVGEVPMGDASKFSLSPGTCALIHTGGMLPEGADSVIMLEYTQFVHKDDSIKIIDRKSSTPFLHMENPEVEIVRAVAEGENIIRIGEDVAEEDVVLKAGTRLRPAEIGGCMALGITRLQVSNKPLIGIISTGDEVVPPYQNPQPGQVRDVNSHSLAALVEKSGGNPVLYGIIPDSLELIKKAAQKALDDCEAVVFTAGSSASARDMTAQVINTLGAPGVLVHGVNIRPGKPTILAVCNGKAVIGLPGNPVSALVIAGLFVVPIIQKLLGLKNVPPRPSVMAKIAVNIPSQAGREDWVAVRLVPTEPVRFSGEKQNWIAEPVFGKSNLIFSLAAADGLVRISPESTGISAGETVEVQLLD
jgi:molybdopterin molybdotransferase